MAGFVAFQQHVSGNIQHSNSLSQQITSGPPASSLPAEPGRRLQIAAYQVARTPQAYSGLFSGGELPGTISVPGVTEAAYSQTRNLIVLAAGQQVQLWDAATHRVLSTVPANGGATGTAVQLREHGAGRRGRQRDHPAVERDATGAPHRRRLPVTGSVGPVSQLAFSPGTDLLGSAGWDHRVRLWNVSDPRHPVLLASIQAGTRVAARCRLLLQSAPAGHGRLGRLRAPLGHHQPRQPALLAVISVKQVVRSVAFEPAGSVLAIGGDDSTNPAISNGDNLYLWDVGNPRAPRRLTAIASGLSNVAAVAFSPTAPLLAATGSFASATALWNIADPGRPASLPSLKGGSLCLAFSPDGQTLATLDQAVRATRSLDDEVELWRRRRSPDAGRPRDGLDRIGSRGRSGRPCSRRAASSPSPAV